MACFQRREVFQLPDASTRIRQILGQKTALNCAPPLALGLWAVESQQDGSVYIQTLNHRGQRIEEGVIPSIRARC
ncbi:hypothetical protein IF2G_00298 [Cordyceps javanica]|nr:hypothetical protein IF2G_00298 [Cordyceps javanica]